MALDKAHMGKTVQDSISGFEGVMTGYLVYLHDTPEVQITPNRVDSDGKKIPAIWIKASQATLAKSNRIGY